MTRTVEEELNIVTLPESNHDYTDTRIKIYSGNPQTWKNIRFTNCDVELNVLNHLWHDVTFAHCTIRGSIESSILGSVSMVNCTIFNLGYSNVVMNYCSWESNTESHPLSFYRCNMYASTINMNCTLWKMSMSLVYGSAINYRLTGTRPAWNPICPTDGEFIAWMRYTNYDGSEISRYLLKIKVADRSKLFMTSEGTFIPQDFTPLKMYWITRGSNSDETSSVYINPNMLQVDRPVHFNEEDNQSFKYLETYISQSDCINAIGLYGDGERRLRELLLHTAN